MHCAATVPRATEEEKERGEAPRNVPCQRRVCHRSTARDACFYFFFFLGPTGSISARETPSSCSSCYFCFSGVYGALAECRGLAPRGVAASLAAHDAVGWDGTRYLRGWGSKASRDVRRSPERASKNILSTARRHSYSKYS